MLAPSPPAIETEVFHYRLMQTLHPEPVAILLSNRDVVRRSRNRITLL
jgi:hypothetical protein